MVVLDYWKKRQKNNMRDESKCYFGSCYRNAIAKGDVVDQEDYKGDWDYHYPRYSERINRIPSWTDIEFWYKLTKDLEERDKEDVH